MRRRLDNWRIEDNRIHARRLNVTAFRTSLVLTLACTPLLAAFAGPEPLNDYGPPEQGHGLKADESESGWISLFDGQTSFGWKDATVEGGRLRGGMTTTTLPRGEVRVELAGAGTLTAGGQERRYKQKSRIKDTGKAGPIALGPQTEIRHLHFRPLDLKPLLNGKNLDGWKRIDRAKLPEEKRPKWTVTKGILEITGGPGALEYQGEQWGDLILQIKVRTRARYSNGGLFFRCIPADFMNGYEAQLHNRCENKDPAKPSIYATGGIDDRQNARRLVSRDGEPFVMTVIAHGPHIATWVNGHQTADWTDTRKAHVNPRQGLRLEAGTIQIQAHDTGSDFEVLELRGAKVE